MKFLIRKCPKCSRYTLKENCPVCGTQTVNPHPPRFSPNDKYARYRGGTTQAKAPTESA